MTRTAAIAGVLLLTATLPGASRAAGLLDQGRLDPAWFGGARMEFREADELDYLWVRPGFALDGRRLRFAPFEPVQLLGEKAAQRRPEERELAEAANPRLHEALADFFAEAFGKRIEVVPEGEEILVEGRIVDCSRSLPGFSMVGPVPTGPVRYLRLTVDLRFVEVATGETVVAIHHRSVTTDWSEWVFDMTEEVARKGFARLYAKGHRVRD